MVRVGGRGIGLSIPPLGGHLISEEVHVQQEENGAAVEVPA